MRDTVPARSAGFRLARAPGYALAGRPDGLAPPGRCACGTLPYASRTPPDERHQSTCRAAIPQGRRRPSSPPARGAALLGLRTLAGVQRAIRTRATERRRQAVRRTIEKRPARGRRAADAVRLSGTLVTSGPYRTRSTCGCKATAAPARSPPRAATFQLLRVGEELYLKAGAGFWGTATARTADPAAAGKLDDKYVKVPAGRPRVQAVQRLHRQGGAARRSARAARQAGHRRSTTNSRGVRTIRITGGRRRRRHAGRLPGGQAVPAAAGAGRAAPAT